MQFTVPDYYKQFTCTAGQCPATCCAGIEEVPEGKRPAKEQAEK